MTAWLATLVVTHPRHVLAWEDPPAPRSPVTVPPGLEQRPGSWLDAREEMRANPGRSALVQVGTTRSALTLVENIRRGSAGWRYPGEWEVRGRTTREVGLVWVRFAGMDYFAAVTGSE